MIKKKKTVKQNEKNKSLSIYRILTQTKERKEKVSSSMVLTHNLSEKR